MTKPGSPKPAPSATPVIPKPPFARLPDPAALFAARAARFRTLAETGELAPYLRFLAAIADLQARIAADLPAPPPLPDAHLERAARHAMPPLERTTFADDAGVHDTLDRLLAGAAAIDMPEAARAALDRLAATDRDGRAAILANLLVDAISADAVAEHVLAAAALQVHFALLAAGLDPDRLKPVADGICPTCGGRPSASLIVDVPGIHGVRYCACALCATEWNYVRAKCTLCSSTRDITLREIAGSGGEVKAELCGDCKGYVKVLYRQKNPALDPIADDVATLGLDLLVRELGFTRGAVDPFLAGY